MDIARINKYQDNLDYQQQRYDEVHGRHSWASNYERKYRDQERASLKGIHGAQRAIFRAENGLSPSAKIEPIAFASRFPGSQALIAKCPAEKRESLLFCPETHRDHTLVAFRHGYLDDHQGFFRSDKKYDWLHHNAASPWFVSCTKAFGALGLGQYQTVICFESEEDAFLFVLAEGGKKSPRDWFGDQTGEWHRAGVLRTPHQQAIGGLS